MLRLDLRPQSLRNGAPPLDGGAPRRSPGGALRSLLLRGRNRGDAAFRGLTAAATLSVVLISCAMVGSLILQSWPSIARFGFGFLFARLWNPVINEYGAAVFIFGTIYTSLLALLIAVPLSLGVAIFLSEVAPPRLRDAITMLVELLAAIPSVVYGLWGMFVLTALVRSWETYLGSRVGGIPFFSGPAYGSGILAAALILTVMIVPTVTSISRDVLRAVPHEQREGMLALGATKWETITRVVIPYARAGIVGAIVLGLGRAVGETMAVTMVIGNGRYVGPSMFGITDTLASVIANQFAEAPGGLYTGALLELGLLLFGLAIVLNVLARLLIWTVAREPETAR